MVMIGRYMLCVMKNNRPVVDGWTASLSFATGGTALILESDNR